MRIGRCLIWKDPDSGRRELAAFSCHSPLSPEWFEGLLSIMFFQFCQGNQGYSSERQRLGTLRRLGYKATAISLKRTLGRLDIVHSGECKRPPMDVLRLQETKHNQIKVQL